jgi:hypothetical protein
MATSYATVGLLAEIIKNYVSNSLKILLSLKKNVQDAGCQSHFSLNDPAQPTSCLLFRVFFSTM